MWSYDDCWKSAAGEEGAYTLKASPRDLIHGGSAASEGPSHRHHDSLFNLIEPILRHRRA